MSMIEVRDLSVARGGRVIVSGLNFELAPGAHAALVGPNGAGKTSLLRTLAGFLKPAAGRIALAGEAEDRGLKLHLLGHRDGLKAPLTARAHLAFWRDLLGAGSDALDAEAALSQVGLAASADLPVRMFSAGMGRRLALARLLAAPRPVWLLDEPAAALDAAGKAILDGLITRHCATGGVVIAAVHEPLGAPTSHTIRLGAVQ